MNFQSEWITNGLNADARENAEKMGKTLKDKRVSTSQIRNVFGEIKKIQALGLDNKGKGRLVMITPKLAYAIGRAGNQEKAALEELMENVAIAVKEIENGGEDRDERFNHFVDYMEAVVAYHRYYGGKN